MTKISAGELLNMLDNQWANISDIAIIGRVGKNKAQIIKKEIKADLENQGYKLPYGLVPMEKVVDYFKINVSYLKKVSTKEATK